MKKLIAITIAIIVAMPQQAQALRPRAAANKIVSRRVWFGWAALELSQAAFGGQQINPLEKNVANQATGDKKTEKELLTLFDTYRGARGAGLLDHELLHLEGEWDDDPLQQEVVKRGLSLGKRFEFAEGLLYHGLGNLDEVLLTNEAKGEFFFTRVAWEWAIGFFRKTSKSPAILVLETDYFNSLVKNGHAELKYFVYTNDKENPYSPQSNTSLDPYPKAYSFCLDGVKEIWVSEEVFERYQRIANASQRSELPLEDQPLIAVQERLRNLLANGKIKVIPGLRHTNLPCSTITEIVKSYARTNEFVGSYVKKRGLLGRIPFFRIEGEADPFRNINKNGFASTLLVSRRQLLNELDRNIAERKKIDNVFKEIYHWGPRLAALLAISSFIIWLRMKKKPAACTTSIRVEDSVSTAVCSAA